MPIKTFIYNYCDNGAKQDIQYRLYGVFVKGGVEEHSVDLVLTDPPYQFIAKTPQGAGFMKKENKKHLEELNRSFGMSFNPIEMLELCKKVCKKFNGYFFTNKNLLKTYIQRAEDNKYKRDILLRLKNNPVPINNGHYLIDKEYIVYIHETGATFNSKEGYKNYFTYETYPIGRKEYNHPTVKPKNLLLNKIKISSNEGDIVFDPYMGSGTTAVACKELNRNFIGCEINPEYVEIANNRLNEIKQPDLFTI